MSVFTEGFEEHLVMIKSEYTVLKEKWFFGEKIDPVFDGTVKDFCEFDSRMQDLYKSTEAFMRNTEQLCKGIIGLADNVVSGMAKEKDQQIAAESCKLKEASNQIARLDAPHSAIAKLRRDMDFNILTPMRQHLMNNRSLKNNLEQRRKRLMEYNSAKKAFEKIKTTNPSPLDTKYVTAEANLQRTKAAFIETDRNVFEWLYILEEYKGDILDSTIQTLKYLQYEFFASSAHALSGVLPKRMEFRPMVEMTPEHLENQVDIELQEGGGSDDENDEVVTDFGIKLITKMEKDGRGGEDNSGVLVDALSLSSLLSQGFDEADARRALRIHNNDTQAAMDWIVNGGKTGPSAEDIQDGVRMPTTIRRIQKLRMRRKAEREQMQRQQAEKQALQQQQLQQQSMQQNQSSQKQQQAQQQASNQINGQNLQNLNQQDSNGPNVDLLSLDSNGPGGQNSNNPSSELSREQLIAALSSGQQLTPQQMVQMQQFLVTGGNSNGGGGVTQTVGGGGNATYSKINSQTGNQPMESIFDTPNVAGPPPASTQHFDLLD